MPAFTLFGIQSGSVVSSPKAAYAADYINSVASLPAASQLILSIPVQPGIERMLMTVGLTTQALSQFLIQGNADPNGVGPFIPLATSGVDYTTPNNFMMKASGDLSLLAAGATGYAMLYVKGFAIIQVKATAAIAGAALTIYSHQT